MIITDNRNAQYRFLWDRVIHEGIDSEYTKHDMIFAHILSTQWYRMRRLFGPVGSYMYGAALWITGQIIMALL